MSMRVLIPAGWLNIVLGLLLGIGGIAGGMPTTGAILLIALVGSGAFMLWLGKGWDTPLEDASELYEYGRPANAEVLAVEDVKLGPDGTRTAKLSVHASPVNESSFKSTRQVALPGGEAPAVGSTITIKFDPNSRKNFVVAEENVQVKDHFTQLREGFSGTQQPS